MKKAVSILMFIVVLLSFSGCGKGEETTDEMVWVPTDEIDLIFTSADKYKNQWVELKGKVFSEPEVYDDSIAFQMFADSEKAEKNTIVLYGDKNFDVKSGEYVKVLGQVYDQFKSENRFGGEITAPRIVAGKIEKMSYKDAVRPTIKECSVNMEKDQYGYKVIIEKVEFAEKETRIYVKVINNGDKEMSIYSHSCVISQNGKQYEQENNYDADYQEIQSNLLSGNTTEGILTFPAIEMTDFKITIDGTNFDYEHEIEPYEFNIAIN